MALNIKDPETERLAAEVAALTGETKSGAVKKALLERKSRLTASVAGEDRALRIHRFLVAEAWPQVPEAALGEPLSKESREEILGYGAEGV